MTRCYAWPLTVRGDELNLHVSTEHAPFGVRLFRFGATVEEVPGPDAAYDGYDLPIGRPDEAWGWPRYTIPLDPELPDGIYLAVPGPVGEPVDTGVSVATRSDAALFIMRRQPVKEILVKLPTATYAAYNQIGGASTYAGAFWVRDWAAQGYVASLQRPGNGGVGGRVMEGDAPDPYARSSRRQVFAHWDAPFVAWLESRGYQVSYCTDFDLHFDDGLLDAGPQTSPSLLLSAGHDEYWSERMRRKVLQFVDRGASMCFFAGDVACFKIEYSDAGDRLFCPKMAGESPEVASRLTGALWHVHDPQDWLTLNNGAYGGGWWDGRRSADAYQPVVADHWIFDGVEIPAGGISGGDFPVIGYETDGVRLERASDPPRMSEHRKGGSGGRTLLAVGKLSAGWVAGYEQANAAIVIRTAQSGGMVFSTGTTDWSLALSDPAVAGITANVIDRLRCRPLVIHGPVCGEGEYIGEGEMVGAGQRVSWYTDGSTPEPRWTVAGGQVSAGSSAAHITTVSGDGDAYLTVSATATDAQGRQYFGSRTVRVAGTEEYLRRRIIRTLDAIAFPDEQGGALVDQGASEAQLASGVIPVRLGWIKHHAAILAGLIADLEARWTQEGRMADASLSEAELRAYQYGHKA
jgi:hypothetical protein